MSALNFSFREVWSISGRQKGILTCAAISPSGLWTVSGSQDGTILFVDQRTGMHIGVLNLEAEFYPTAAIWCSDTILVFGGSNGVLYHLDFEHRSRRPIGVRPLVKPFESPVRALAFDTFRDMLAVGYGGEVSIYVRADEGGTESWGCVDHIHAPCASSAGLVTALCFFGTALSRRHLFIGHAKAGWSVWLAPRTYTRTPFTQYGDVCSIGSATIPPSERFIAFATLDNYIVTYSLGEGGPDINTRSDAKPREPSSYRPALPIVSTSSELVVKGTVIGDIDFLDTRTQATMSLQHAHNHIIRTLNAHGDKVVIGSSDFTESSTGSDLRCHTISAGAEPRDWHRIDELQGPIFEITLNSILPFNERFVPRGRYLGAFDIGQAVRLNFRQKKAVFLLVGFCVLLLALASEQSLRASSVPTQGIQIARTPNSRSTAPPRNPTLSALLGWSAGYISSQVSEWVLWSTQTVAWILKLVSYGAFVVVKALLFALSSFTHVVFLIPRYMKTVLGEVPDLLANLICDILRTQGFSDVCPE